MSLRKHRWLRFVLIGSCILTSVSLLSEVGWIFDLATHFRLQYLLVQVLAVLYLLVKRRNLLAVLIVPFLIVNWMQIRPYFEKASDARVLTGKASLKILHMNLFANRNWNYAGVMTYIREVDPDIVSIQEFEKKWPKHLYDLGLAKAYPYRIKNSQTALFSRLPLVEPEIIHTAYPAQYLDSVLTAKVNTGTKQIRILVTHTLVPTNPDGFEKQRQLFQGIVKLRQQRFKKDDIFLIGDLNTTPWSVNFRILGAAGLTDSRLGYGVQPTWPILLPFALMPIDHVLVSDNVQVSRYQTGPFIGSDHLPIIVELGLKERAGEGS